MIGKLSKLGYVIIRQKVSHVRLSKMFKEGSEKGCVLFLNIPDILSLFNYTKSTPDKPNITLENLNQTGKANVNIVFRVTDCRKVYSDLKESGLKFLTEPQSPTWGGWRVFTQDPDGYLIEFEQPG